MKLITFFGAATLLLLSACAPIEPRFDVQTILTNLGAGLVEYDVRLKPQNDGTIELPNNAKCSKGNDKKGCIAFDPGIYGILSFSVSGPGKDNKTCADSGVHWVITQIQIADTGNIDTGKSSDFGDPVSPATQASLYPFQDPATGTVYSATWQTGRTSIGILNRNDNPPNTTTDFWYKVVATKCDGSGQTAETDPRIENKGR